MSFDDACVAVIDTLKRSMPLGFWSVSRRDGDRQVHVAVRDDVYGIAAGDSSDWSDSYCRTMATGSTPAIAPDVLRVPEYAATSHSRAGVVRAYAGAPITGADGTLYGSLCGLDPAAQPDELVEQAPLLELLAALLGQILTAERLRAQVAERQVELSRQVFHDQLTGLPNRLLFLERLGHALALRRRLPDPLAVLLLDLEDFSSVNDSFGHRVGDQLLVAVAERVGSVLRDGDTLVRLGGDEFAVLVEDGGDAVAAAERVVASLEAPFDLSGAQVAVRGTVGLAELPPTRPPVDVDTLLAHADIALYAAKRGDMGRVVVYDPVMTVPELQDLRLREPLRRAIEAGEVELHFQPIVDLATSQIAGFESLSRWTLAGEAVPPDVFIPVAARAGLLPALTAHVLELACRQLARWSAATGSREVRVGINVPPGLLTDLDFPDRVAAALQRHGLDPWQLVLEITEDALLVDLDTATVVTRRLREAGISLSLDDFGTGYSSLLHLREIPLATFKVDRAFTRDIDTDPRAEQFVRALVSLGRDLGMDVVAEGVERHGQAAVLRDLGCQYAQGWLYAPAMPADEVVWQLPASLMPA